MGTTVDRRTGERVAIVLLGLALGSCMGPSGQARRVERAIRERIDDLELPRATQSRLDPIPEGVRVRLHDHEVELDDVSSWLALGDERLGRRVTEGGGPPWTHVSSIALEPMVGEGGAALASPVLLEAMKRVHEGAATATELRGGSGEPQGYTVFAEADASFREVVRVLYNASHAELVPSRLAARGRDGTIGVLPVFVPRYCVEDDEDDEPTHAHHGSSCWRPDVTVVGRTIVVRGRDSWETNGECLRAKRYVPPSDERAAGILGLATAESDDGDVWAELGLGDEGLIGSRPSEPPPPPPPPPCRTVTVEQVQEEPASLRRAIEELATDEVCGQAELGAIDDAHWQDVITAFDAMRSLGHDRITLAAPVEVDLAGCEPAGG